MSDTPALLSEPRESWQQAALRVGEALADAGPEGYYDMTPNEWREWALSAIRHFKATGQV